jgi:hypothetical protein
MLEVEGMLVLPDDDHAVRDSHVEITVKTIGVL